ncbi:MAG: hypothetical protein ACFCU9_08965 [Cyanophyceae cyanobacterium]
MDEQQIIKSIDDFLKKIIYQPVETVLFEDGVDAYIRRSACLPGLYWDEDHFKGELGLEKLPRELELFWYRCSSLLLHFTYDKGFRIEGIYIYSPEQVLLKHKNYIKEITDDGIDFDFKKGDLLIGERIDIGEKNYVFMRCDKDDEDFGVVIVTLPEYLRNEGWVTSSSLMDFLETIYLSKGKYWKD